MDKKPLLDSDIDPKRIHKVADGLRRQGEFESARMLDGYADLLEAREKAVPVMVVNHVSSAEHDLPIGMKLYAHPSPSDAEKRDTMTPRELAKRIERGEKWKLAGEAAQAQSQSSEWVMVPREPTRAMHQQITAGRLGGATNEVVWKSILAAAPQQAAEPMGWMASDNTGRVIDAKAKAAGSRAAATASATAIYSIPLYDIPQPQAAEPVAYALFTEKGLVRMWSRDWFGDPHSAVKHGAVPLYTHPQPAQDAALYQELLMAVSKKFPNESRHETALRYIKQTELQSCEPKCDAAMAQESGR